MDESEYMEENKEEYAEVSDPVFPEHDSVPALPEDDSALAIPEDDWMPEEQKVFAGLYTVPRIQAYIDALKYESKPDGAYSPRMTIKWGYGHCFGGAILAAAALQRIGIKPYLVHLETDLEVDDDHVITAYQVDGYWGALGKSNYSTLRARDPVYHSVRELAMSYFDFYFSVIGVKSMIGYSDPVDLDLFLDRGPEKKSWLFAEENMEDLDRVLCYEVPHHKVVTKRQEKHLMKASEQLLKASTLFSNWDGLFKPKTEGLS